MPLSGQCDVTPLKMEKHKPNCISKISVISAWPKDPVLITGVTFG